MVVPAPRFGFPTLAEQLGLNSVPVPDYLDTFGILAEAAAELKCAARILYANQRLPAETLASARAAAERTIEALRTMG